MTAIDLQTEIVRMIKDEQDLGVLEAIRTLLHKVRRENTGTDEDFTAEELAELELRRARHLRGEGTSYSMEESLRRLRNSGK